MDDTKALVYILETDSHMTRSRNCNLKTIETKSESHGAAISIP